MSRKQTREKEIKRKQPIRIETGTFSFPNGDKYDGEFAIDLKTNTIFRQGSGTYKTTEGHVYEGKWLNDKLVIKAKVLFPDNCYYEGTLDETPTYAYGTLNFCDQSELKADFKKLLNGVRENATTTFTDPNGRVWDIRYEAGVVELRYPWNWRQFEQQVDMESCPER